MAEHRLAGRTAAKGIAFGRLYALDLAPAAPPEAIATDLASAIAASLDQLRTLQRAVDTTAAEIIEFQIELLLDPELTKAAFDDIRKGCDQAEAFTIAMDTHIRGYEEADSEFFSARAADVRDLRDRVLRALSGQSPEQRATPSGILLCDELTPTRFLETDWTHTTGVVTTGGSPASHAAMLARARGIPLLVDLQGDIAALPGRNAILDADSGFLLLDPGPASIVHYRRLAEDRHREAARSRDDALAPAISASGRTIRVYLNVDDLGTLEATPRKWFDGIGLARSELLLARQGRLCDEEAEIALYRRLFEWSAGATTTIRLLDAGGDKPIAGLTLAHERNPFLGVRGIRLLLRHPDLLRRQMRAIVCAAEGRPTRIMIPMVTIADEVAACRDMLDEVLRASGAPPHTIELGTMVETPALALTISALNTDFLSIGTNDLTQYVMAAARDSSELGHLHAPGHPAILELVTRVIAYGHVNGIDVSVCGDAITAPAMLHPLLSAGLGAVSVSAKAAPAIKAAIRQTTHAVGSDR